MKQRYLSIKTKFIILHGVAMLVFVALISIMFIYVRGQMYDISLSKNAEIMTVFSAGVENELDSINDNINNFFAGESAMAEFEKLELGLGEFEGYQAYKRIDTMLVQHNVINDVVEGISYFVSGMPPVSFGYKTSVAGIEQKAQTGVIKYYKTDDSEYIYGTKIIDGRDSILVITLNIQRLLRSAYSIYGEQFRSRFMIAKGSELIYCDSDDMVHLLSTGSIEGLKNRGTKFFVSGKERYIAHYVYSDNTGWYYYNIVKEKEVFRNINYTVTCLLLLAIALFIILAFMVYIISGRITHRLRLLSGKIRSVEEGIYEQIVPDDATSRFSDETDLLMLYYGNMVSKIHELIDIDMKKEILLNKAKYDSLKSQINPHFLYNTLETVKSLALTERGKDAARVVDELSALLRSCLNLPKYITIGDELKLIEHYIGIHKIRYGDRLSFEADISEKARDISFPCMLIQPLIENSIKHALEAMIEPCRIVLSAYYSSGKLVLTVRDNGPGFPENNDCHSHGVGLQYIRERLHLEYGDRAYLETENISDGCEVRIIINKEEASDVQNIDC